MSIDKVAGAGVQSLAKAVNSIIDAIVSAPAVVTLSAATKAVTAAESGTRFLIGIDGIAITLPAAVKGLKYDFDIVTSQTLSNVILVSSAASGQLIKGSVSILAAAATAAFSADGSDDYRMTLSATTKGGLAGGKFSLICHTDGEWLAGGLLMGSGTLATPFS